MSTYSITVKPGSSQEKLVENPDGTITVYLHASAHDGEANASLIKLLAKHFKIPKTTITITRGAHSRRKIVEF